MMDKEQLDFVFNVIPLSFRDIVLDMGCGSGSILNALAEKSGCNGIGIDQLCRTTINFENKNIRYFEENIDDIEKFNLNPTVTLLVDSIYFSRDPEKLIRYLCHIKNNRIYLFYSQYLFDNDIADKG